MKSVKKPARSTRPRPWLTRSQIADPARADNVRFAEGAGSAEVEEFVAGLRGHNKRVSSKFFYDAEGSRLFEEICQLEEYYPTRTEESILAENLPEIANLLGPQVQVVELGSGSDRKIRLVLEHLRDVAAYVPIDISESSLRAACEALRKDFADLKMQPLCTDYTNGLKLPKSPAGGGRQLLFFPGSTLGNMEPIEALAFLRKLSQVAEEGVSMLIGIDLKKDRAVLEAAYNDRRGVTAAFNRNILARANREFGANFVPSTFAHRAFFDEEHRRIVMQLESEREQTVTIAGEPVHFAAGERITTEYSYKYTVGEFQALARLSGFAPWRVWMDAEKKFSVHLLTVCPSPQP